MSNGVSFHQHIFPLIEERCLDCHSEPYVKNGRTIHPKAGLRLDTYEAIIEGNLDGTIIEKGNAESVFNRPINNYTNTLISSII